MMKLIILLFITNFISTHSTKEAGEGSTKRTKNGGKVPEGKEIVDRPETAVNAHQNMSPQLHGKPVGFRPYHASQASLHSIEIPQKHASSTNLQSASSGKRKLISEMGASRAQKRAPIKITIIGPTTFHPVDQHNFREAVQQLTGNNYHQTPSNANIREEQPYQQGNQQQSSKLPSHPASDHYGNAQGNFQTAIISGGNIAELEEKVASVFNERATKITSILVLHGEMDVLRTLAQSRVVGRQEMERKWAEKAAQLGTLAARIDELGHQEAQTHLNLIRAEQKLLKPIPYETYLQDQFKRAHRKLGEKRKQQAQLCQKIANLVSNTQEMVDNGELGQNVAELSKVAQQIERLVYQDRAIFQRMVFDEKVREKIEWAEPKNDNIENCGPRLFHCAYCDAILCEVYDSICSWNLTLKRCVAYKTETSSIQN